MTSTISIVEYRLLEVCTLFDPKAPVERERTVPLHANNFLRIWFLCVIKKKLLYGIANLNQQILRFNE